MEKKFKIVLLILLFILLTFLSFLFSPLFNIREFIVHSRIEINNNDIRKNVNKFYGKNLLFLNEKSLKMNLLKHKLISAVEIEKAYPSVVHIIIEVRKAVAVIENNEKNLVFSADGNILDEYDLEMELPLPRLEGFPYYFVDNKIYLPELTDDIIQVLHNLSPDYLAQIKKIIYKNEAYKLYLKNGGGVNLGRNEDLTEKFAILNSIITKNQDSKIDYINLQITEQPVIKFK